MTSLRCILKLGLSEDLLAEVKVQVLSSAEVHSPRTNE
jgi:hypothetical protein